MTNKFVLRLFLGSLTALKCVSGKLFIYTKENASTGLKMVFLLFCQKTDCLPILLLSVLHFLEEEERKGDMSFFIFKKTKGV